MENSTTNLGLTGDPKEKPLPQTVTKKDFDIFLLTRLQLGDEEAFRHIFTRWEAPLFHFVKRMTGSEEDAEDICQETFASLWVNHSSIDPEKNIKTYIFLIAKQIAWKYLRESKRKEGFLSDPGLDADDSISPESIVQLKEMELLTEYAISKLPARTRDIYNLYYRENLTYEQIADRLGTNAVNVKTQIYQARQKIRDIIALLVIVLLS